MSEAHRIAEYCAGKSLSVRSSYRVPCPAHGGKDNNLSISEGRSGRTVFTCHSHGCTFEQIMESIPESLLDEKSPSLILPRKELKPQPVTLARKPDSNTFDFGKEVWLQSEWVESTDHAYAVKKRITSLGPRVRVGVLPRKYAMLEKGDCVLVIQMYDEDGCEAGFQFINENGDRAFAGSQGMLVLSNRWWDKKTVLHVVEGFATGTAVNQVFPGEENVPVVAFSQGNMPKVHQLLSQRIERERGFVPVIRVHHEPEGIDLWDVVHDPVKRARYIELQKEAA